MEQMNVMENIQMYQKKYALWAVEDNSKIAYKFGRIAFGVN